MKKLIMMACTMVMVLAAPIAASAGTIYVGNISPGNYNNSLGGYLFPGKSGYFLCNNNFWSSSLCASTYIEVSVSASVSSDTGGSQSNPTRVGTCTFSSCVCAYDEYLSGNLCKKCITQTNHETAVATSDKSYHTKTSCNECLPDKLGMAPYTNVVVCYCPENGTCADRQVTCNKGYYKVPGSSTSQTRCEACEDGATTSAAGATSHTECCYPSSKTFSDTIGTYKYASGCCYTE